MEWVAGLGRLLLGPLLRVGFGGLHLVPGLIASVSVCSHYSLCAISICSAWALCGLSFVARADSTKALNGRSTHPAISIATSTWSTPFGHWASPLSLSTSEGALHLLSLGPYALPASLRCCHHLHLLPSGSGLDGSGLDAALLPLLRGGLI